MDLIIPKNLNYSIDPDWEILEQLLPNGYRHIASVERPDKSMHDLGQNKEGEYLLFPRSTDPQSLYSHKKGVALSPVDYAGFGLRAPSRAMSELTDFEGEYTPLCRSHWIPNLGV